MGIFDSIKGAIWGDDKQSAEAAHAAPSQEPVIIASDTADKPSTSPDAVLATVPARSAASTKSGPQMPEATPVDVAAMLDAAVKRKGERLDWRRSIIDLMKSLEIDSSLVNRKALASELHYTGDTSDSAAMNTWLHKTLMMKLAENGGHVPPELLD